ncbi:MAG TPA: SdpI family protein [Allosphingosinicella sp.]
MTRKAVGIASALTVCSIIGAALVAGSILPEAIQLPIHWGLNGEADAFADKWTALLMPGAIVAAVSLLFHFMPVLEPRREGLARSQGLYLWGWIAILLMGVVIEFAVIAVAFGWGVSVNHLIVGAVGIMLVMIGNQLGKSRSMYLIGLRTPWTLASEEVWIKTHRLAGKLMVAGGLAMVAAALLPLPSGLLITVPIAAVALIAGVSILYSFILWRRERMDQASG